MSRDDSDSSIRALTAGAFSLPGLVAIIGYRLTANIASISGQTLFEWLRNGLPIENESRMKAAFDVVKLVAEVESTLRAQDFLVRHREEMGAYGTAARMLREADVEVARHLLTSLVTTEFLSNEVSDLADVDLRLKEWIKHAELPERVAYISTIWQGWRLSLVLAHSGFPEEVQRKWDKGIDWPGWDQIIAAVLEMECARLDIDLTTGCPFRYLRPRRFLKTTERNACT